MTIKHQAFLDLEGTLERRLKNAWGRYWTQLSNQIQDRLDRGDWDGAHRLAESVDLAPLFERSRVFARTVGMSALLLGASRLGKPRDSRVKRNPPLKELDAYLGQLGTMLSRNASQKLRDMAHAWVAEEESKLLKAEWDESKHPRVPGGHGDESGQFTHNTGGYAQRIARDLDVAAAQDASHKQALGRVISRLPFGTTLKRGKVTYTRTDVGGDAFWIPDGRGHTYTDAQAGVEFGLKFVKAGLLTDDQFHNPVGVEKFDPSQPRHPKGTPKGGQWVDMKVTEHPRDIFPLKVVVPGGAGSPDAIKLEAIRSAKGIQVKLSLAADAWQGAGLGVRAYVKLVDYAHSKGLPLFSDGVVSGDAKRVYDALKARGYTVEVNPEAVPYEGGMISNDWVYRVTNPHLEKSEVAKLDLGAGRNQVKINVAGKQYFGIAASVQVSRLSAFGFLLEAAESGLTNYRVDAVMDERTCAVCQQMDGWVFPVEAGLQQAQLIMDTDDPDTLKQIAPFYAQNKQAIAELITYSTDDWVSMGMHLPPYHPLCRCILTPTEEKADLHPTQQSDRVAVASQTLYGQGDGVRLTRELFGIEEPTEADKRSIGDVIPDAALEPEDVASWLDLITDSGNPPPVLPVTEEAVKPWIDAFVEDLLAQPAADVPRTALVTPAPFEGSTVPQQYREPFRPSKLAQLAQSRWPWLAGILGWLAVQERDQFGPNAEEQALIAEEELADIERDERNELREDRRR